MEISSQTVLITGAASGLGKATATLLSSLGAKLVLLDKQVTEANIIACDLTDAHQLKNIIGNLPEIPRICVNCAGIIHAKKVLYTSPEEFENILINNIMSTYNILNIVIFKIHQLAPVNEDGERGVMINVSSIAAFEGQAGQAAYSASKGAIASMTLPLARECSPYGIRIMAIAPGVMETPMMSEVREDIRQALITHIPFPKRLGKPEEFAKLVRHIIENSYLNGAVIRLDGGLRMV